MCELNPIRIFIINRFYKTIPYTRILVSLSIIDDLILKSSNNDIENIPDDIHNLREQSLYMGSCEKTVKDEQQNLIGDKDQSGNEDEDKHKYTLPIIRLNSSK